jgi:vacuolar protein sorting-associated protein VTA1
MFLGEVLGVLEGMRSAISNEHPEAKETVDSESASAAYVENFALKIFASADDEDRRGSATKSVEP